MAEEQSFSILPDPAGSSPIPRGRPNQSSREGDDPTSSIVPEPCANAPSDEISLSKASHQEVMRVQSELELLFAASQAEKLPVESIGHYLMIDLGYDDQAEFEDALKCTFLDFLKGLPNCTVWEEELPKALDNDASSLADVTTESLLHTPMRLMFRIEAVSGKPPQKLSLRIEDKASLWRSFLFGPSPAKVVIPELEFEIAGVEKNVADSIYNHVARAVTNLEQHAQRNKDAASASNILVAVEELRQCLDLDRSWTFEVHDPEGICEFTPADAVEVTPL